MKLRDFEIGVMVFWICFLLILCRTVPANSLEWKLKAGDKLSWRFENFQIDSEVPVSFPSFPSVPLSRLIEEGDLLTIHILSVDIVFDSQWIAEYNYTVGDQEGYRIISHSDLSWEVIFPVYARSFYENEASRINTDSATEEASLTGDIFQITHESRSGNATMRYNIVKGCQTYFYLETYEAIIEYKIVENSDSLFNPKLLTGLLGLAVVFLLGIITGIIIQPVMAKPTRKDQQNKTYKLLKGANN